MKVLVESGATSVRHAKRRKSEPYINGLGSSILNYICVGIYSRVSI